MSDVIKQCPTCKGKGHIHVKPHALDEAVAKALKSFDEFADANFAAASALRQHGRNDLASRLEQAGAFAMVMSGQDASSFKEALKTVYEEGQN